MSKHVSLLFVLAAACGDSSTASPDAPKSPDAATPDADTSHVTMSSNIRDFVVGQPLDTAHQAPLAGVTVCSVDHGPDVCATTDANGDYALRVPKGVPIDLTLVAAGHVQLYFVGQPPLDADKSGGVLYLPSVAEVDSFYKACDSTAAYAPTDTVASVAVRGFQYLPPSTYHYLDGATESVSAGKGPCYMSDAYTYTAGQLTTTTAGLGHAVFPNVTVGGGTADVHIVFASATTGCYSNGHTLVENPGSTTNTIRVPLRAGFQTYFDAICE